MTKEPTPSTFRRRTVLGSLVPGSLGLALAVQQARAADAVRIVGSADTQHGSLEAMERLRRGLEETTRGRFAFTIDSQGAADDKAALEQVRSGQATLGWVRVAEVAELAPELALLTVPFLFMDQQKMMGLLERTSIAPLLNDQLRKQGLEPLAYLDGGALRLAGATAPSLSGLQGRQIAARPGRLRMVAFEALGLTPLAGTPQPQQPAGEGLLELRTDDLAGIAAGGPGLVIAEPPHAHDLLVVLAHRDRFGELPLDIRETIRTKTGETTAWQRGAAAQGDAVALQALRQRGVALPTLPEGERRDAHDRVKAAMAKSLRDADQHILSTVLAYAD
jgi:TRAP-type C4-dicarboxylate transport system substrate-binding protein